MRGIEVLDGDDRCLQCHRWLFAVRNPLLSRSHWYFSRISGVCYWSGRRRGLSVFDIQTYPCTASGADILGEAGERKEISRRASADLEAMAAVRAGSLPGKAKLCARLRGRAKKSRNHPSPAAGRCRIERAQVWIASSIAAISIACSGISAGSRSRDFLTVSMTRLSVAGKPGRRRTSRKNQPDVYWVLSCRRKMHAWGDELKRDAAPREASGRCVVLILNWSLRLRRAAHVSKTEDAELTSCPSLLDLRHSWSTSLRHRWRRHFKCLSCQLQRLPARS